MTTHKLSMADEAVITALTAKQAVLETEIEYLRHELAVLVHGIDAESERLRGQLAAVTAERDELVNTLRSILNISLMDKTYWAKTIEIEIAEALAKVGAAGGVK